MAESNSASNTNKTRRDTCSSEASPPQKRDSPGWSASKRHREKLNEELENLGKLLPFPEDTLEKLDKLSVLRLTTSYIRLQTYIQGRRLKECKNSDEDVSTESKNHAGHVLGGEISNLLLEMIEGFIIVICDDGVVFYVSENTDKFTGYCQTSLLHHQFTEYIHEEDQAHFKLGINFEKQKTRYLKEMGIASDERSLQEIHNSFICRIKCHAGRQISHVSPFYHKAFKFQGILKPLHSQNEHFLPRYAFFAMCNPIKQNGVLLAKPRDNNPFFNTKHGMDLSFQTMDPLGLKILGYGKSEISHMSPYFIAHPDDMFALQKAHHEIIIQGHTSCTFRLLNKHSKWQWISGSGQVFFKDSKPNFVLTTNRGVSDEEAIEVRMRWEAERNMKTIDEKGNKIVQSGPAMPSKSPRQLMTRKPKRSLKLMNVSQNGKPTTEKGKKSFTLDCEQSENIENRHKTDNVRLQSSEDNFSLSTFQVTGKQLPDLSCGFLSDPGLMSLGLVFPMNPHAVFRVNDLQHEQTAQHNTVTPSCEYFHTASDKQDSFVPPLSEEAIIQTDTNAVNRVTHINLLPTYEEALSLYKTVYGAKDDEPNTLHHVGAGSTIQSVGTLPHSPSSMTDLSDGSMSDNSSLSSESLPYDVPMTSPSLITVLKQDNVYPPPFHSNYMKMNSADRVDSTDHVREMGKMKDILCSNSQGENIVSNHPFTNGDVCRTGSSSNNYSNVGNISLTECNPLTRTVTDNAFMAEADICSDRKLSEGNTGVSYSPSGNFVNMPFYNVPKDYEQLSEVVANIWDGENNTMVPRNDAPVQLFQHSNMPPVNIAGYNRADFE